MNLLRCDNPECNVLVENPQGLPQGWVKYHITRSPMHGSAALTMCPEHCAIPLDPEERTSDLETVLMQFIEDEVQSQLDDRE